MNSQLRRTGYTPIGGITADVPAAFGGGLAGTASVSGNISTGQLSLGILGAMVVGAVAFYIWTRSVQGG
jgi:hypothetical protein